MGIIDWIIVVILLFFLVWGLRRGFAAMLIQLLGYLALFLLVGQYYPLVKSSLIAKYSFPGALASVAAFILIALLVGVVARLVIYFLSRSLKLLNLSLLNRLAGGLFGFMNALFILMILTVVLDYIPKLSTPLKDKNRHLAYYTVDQIKTQALETFSLRQHLLMIESRIEGKIPKLPNAPGTPVR